MGKTIVHFTITIVRFHRDLHFLCQFCTIVLLFVHDSVIFLHSSYDFVVPECGFGVTFFVPLVFPILSCRLFRSYTSKVAGGKCEKKHSEISSNRLWTMFRIDDKSSFCPLDGGLSHFVHSSGPYIQVKRGKPKGSLLSLPGLVQLPSGLAACWESVDLSRARSSCSFFFYAPWQFFCPYEVKILDEFGHFEMFLSRNWRFWLPTAVVFPDKTDDFCPLRASPSVADSFSVYAKTCAITK